jgi:processing peptidase subunit beta
MSQDTGLWGIYFVTDAYNQENMVFNIAQEWMRLCTSVTDFEVGKVGMEQGLRDNFYR